MAGGLVLLLVLLLIVVPTTSTAAASIFQLHGHGHGHGNGKEQDQEEEDHESSYQQLQHVLPGGLHSFTKGRGVYRFMAREFLEAHNRVRAKYGVPPLRWSSKLAKQARRWSMQRHVDCLMKHSHGVPYGENVFWGSGWDWRAVDAVTSWASEAAFYDWPSQTCYAGRQCGHFTQLVWNDTELVGCGRSECITGGVIITCNYDPPGNWKGETPLT